MICSLTTFLVPFPLFYFKSKIIPSTRFILGAMGGGLPKSKDFESSAIFLLT